MLETTERIAMKFVTYNIVLLTNKDIIFMILLFHLGPFINWWYNYLELFMFGTQ